MNTLELITFNGEPLTFEPEPCEHPRCDALHHEGVNAILPCPWKTEDPVPSASRVAKCSETRYNGDMNQTPKTYTPETKEEREARVRATMARYHNGSMLRDILAQGEATR